MPFPLRPFARDLDQTLPSVQKLEVFQKTVDFAISEGARVLEVAPEAKQWIKLLENVYWRAEDYYFLKQAGVQLSPGDVYHPTFHYLFGRKFGYETAERPLSLLMAESLASMSEFWFALECMRQFGFNGRHETGFITTLIEHEQKRHGIEQAQAAAQIANFLRSEQADPFAAYQRSVSELFTFFRKLYDAAAGRIEGQQIDFASFARQCEKLRYGTLILRFHVGLNVADAIAFSGKEPSEADHQTVSDSLALLRKSSSMQELLEELGISDSKAEKTSA